MKKTFFALGALLGLSLFAMIGFRSFNEVSKLSIDHTIADASQKQSTAKTWTQKEREDAITKARDGDPSRLNALIEAIDEESRLYFESLNKAPPPNDGTGRLIMPEYGSKHLLSNDEHFQKALIEALKGMSIIWLVWWIGMLDMAIC